MGRRSITAMTGVILLWALLTASGCGCGFDCNNGGGNDSGPASLTLGISDAALEDLKQVVITVDSVALVRNSAANVVIDTFTIAELGLTDAESFQVDLLDYRGRNQLSIIEALELDVGAYSEIVFTILGGDINLSYVQESDDTLKQINVAAAGLSLPGISLSSGDAEYIVEFSLAQSLQFDSSQGDYQLNSDGIRVEDNSVAASLSGRVDSSLFDTVAPCDAKTDPESGNRIYLYSGSGLATGALADVFTSNSSSSVPAIAETPFAVGTLVDNALTGSWEYVFGFLPAGSYTLAVSCDASEDNPVDYDEITIPLPEDQRYEIELSESELATCDLADGATCS